MLHPTLLGLASSAKGYQNRVMVYAHRRQKARYLAPKNVHVRTPLANKMPEEYHHTWDPRTGVEWHNRMRHRGHFRHWPWARWTDDALRQHQDSTHYRTFSAFHSSSNAGMPEWNYYQEVGQDYRTPSHFPLTYVGPFIYQYSSKVWTREKLKEYLEMIQEGTGHRTIAAVAANMPSVYHWCEGQMGKLPLGVVQHVDLVVQDIVAQNARRAFRTQQQQSGVLRTREMERYYALPHLSGAAMPVTLTQPSGAYPWGRYTFMEKTCHIHPLHRPDGRYKHNMYPV